MISISPGGRFGMWEALEGSGGKDAKGKILCRCDCGTVRQVRVGNLVQGLTTGCGCKRLEGNAARLRKHGHKSDRLYQTWVDMLGRCYNPNFRNFVDYGGRGITVCDEWTSFDRFRADVGPHPGEGFSIDRVDNDGGYEPSNVKWSTKKEQNGNTRRSVHVTLDGVTKTGLDWSKELGMNHSTVYYRIKKARPLGIPDEVAIRSSRNEFRKLLADITPAKLLTNS